MVDSTEQDVPFSYNVFNLAFTEAGAIEYFDTNLPAEAVGFNEGQTGVGQVYEALLDYYHNNRHATVDPIAFRSWMQHETEIHQALGGEAGVSVFVDLVMSVDPPQKEAVVSVLKFRNNKRKQADALQELQALILKREQKSDDDHRRITYLTDQIRTLQRDIGYDPMSSVTTADDLANRATDLWKLPDFLPTQFPSLNKAMGYTENGGFFKGAVHAVLAPSGHGKSTFVKCLMNHWVENGKTVLYVNFEEAQDHWERVLMTQVTESNVYRADEYTEGFKENQTQIFRDKMETWKGRFYVRHDPESIFFEDIERWIRDVIGHGTKLDALIIDTINSMFTKSGGNKQRWGQIEEMMVRMEKLAKDMNAALIITAQENTNRMKERREVVEQSDTGGGITIQQKSAVTIFITRKKLLGDDSVDENIMQLQIPKNRITGSTFTLEPPMVKYVDEIKTYVPYEPLDDADYNTTDLVLDDLTSLDDDFI